MRLQTTLFHFHAFEDKYKVHVYILLNAYYF